MTQEPERDGQATRIRAARIRASRIRATRRDVLAGTGVAGLAGVVSACSSGGQGSVTASSSAGSAAGGGGAGAGNALATTGEIPVGGGKVFSSANVVVTQPQAGQFKGFSATCTHAGCTVDQVANGTIDCPCHGSQFSIKDGVVVAGPAPSPLPIQPIKVTGTSIALG